jgi:hypothetical protein
MSLPWGGLNDIGRKLDANGACVQDCTLVLWHTPHKTHNYGKEVDITVRNLDRHQKLLLSYS